MVRVFDERVNLLGEGPFWHDKQLYWVDILGGKILRKRGDSPSVMFFQIQDDYPSSVCVSNDKKIYLTLRKGFYRLDKRLEEVALINEDESIRFNDGKVDGLGRYWAGTMDNEEKEVKGALYILDKEQKAHCVLEGVGTSNGLCWGEGVFYYVDSPTKTIKKYYYDQDAMTLIGGDVLYEVEQDDVYPDGMCIDEEGHLWLALWNGFKVLRINSESGEVMQEIEIPCKKVTSCCFGGAERDQLFITTASKDMNEKDWKEYPDSGKVFVAEPGTKGPLLDLYKGSS